MNYISIYLNFCLDKGDHLKIDELFNDKKVEPNSRLGQAMKYWINNKEGLTQNAS
ncbi:hypothetical protein [Rickettsia endosymbiont of Oedothorax gibbosus]|uniref:hypothetical protein n=1 Tax=Rickettsia endosymbiont of Oedothorax gibbosus TaxID=931099 RepID=UPI00202587F5|nr:hypothetical protein [Rickettsia endosymbiont of Oedothorax gibbosus]